MPRMRHTSLATIHLRPPLANTWTGQGLLPAAWKVTAVVGWRPVDAMTDVAPLARRDDQYGGSEATGSRPYVLTGHPSSNCPKAKPSDLIGLDIGLMPILGSSLLSVGRNLLMQAA